MNVRSLLARGSTLVVLAAAFAQEPPQVTAHEPAQFARDVATTTQRLAVTFDRDMDRRRSSDGSGFGPAGPRTMRGRFRDARTFEWEVELARDRLYVLALGAGSPNPFVAADGTELPATEWCFATEGEPVSRAQAEAATVQLFRTVRDHYALHDLMGVDWASLRERTRSQLADGQSGASLALVFAEALAAAQDPQVAVAFRNSIVPSWRREPAPTPAIERLARTLPRLAPVGRTALMARTDDGIGYLQLTSFERGDGLAMLRALRSLLDCRALVVDVRAASGRGDPALARRIAAFFVAGEVVYASQRARDPEVRGGFAEPVALRLVGSPAAERFTGQVAVLMGAANMATSEHFLLMMKQGERVLLVGQRSFGSSSDAVAHPLLPGLSVLLPASQTLTPDGTAFEGTGLEPHLHVPDAGGTAGVDPVLAEALSRLRRQ